MVEESDGMTVKELVLRLDAKFDTYIHQHELQHGTLIPSGQLSRDLDHLNHAVDSHERTIQRITGALILMSALGIGTLVILVLRITGIII